MFDADHVTCNDVINPGDIDCGVAVIPVDPLEYFEVFNNGTIPGILARKNISISLFNANGKLILSNKTLSTQSYYDLSAMADGFYLMVVRSEDKSWPVKLVRVGR